MRVDLKSVIIGVLLGFILMLVVGANGRGGAGFGFAVPAGSKALVKDAQGTALIVDMDTYKVHRVVFKKPSADAPNYPSPKNGYELRLF